VYAPYGWVGLGATALGARPSAQRGAIAHPGTARERAASAAQGRIASAVAGNARAVTQARQAMDRWAKEGGLVPLEPAALLRATSSRR
jgi:hypothetical protein